MSVHRSNYFFSVYYFFLFLSICLFITGCQTTPPPSPKSTPPACPADAPSPPQIPYSHPLHELPDYWLASTADADRLMLTAAEIQQLNQQIRSLEKPTTQPTENPLDPMQKLKSNIDEFAKLIEQGKLVQATGATPSNFIAQQQKKISQFRSQEKPTWHFALDDGAIRCLPTNAQLYEKAWDISFDLLQCSDLHLAEPVRVIGKLNDFWYIETAYSTGWVEPSHLSPELTDEEIPLTLASATNFLVFLSDRVPLLNAEGTPVGVGRLGSKLPIINEDKETYHLKAPHAAGNQLLFVSKQAAVSRGYLPFTRRNLLQTAFRLLHSPYGWGGMAGRRDCSRFLFDLFRTFGFEFPRNSSDQSGQLPFVDVHDLSPKDKLARLRELSTDNVILLYLPGHIMLYLHEDSIFRLPYAIHEISGFLQSCPGGGETKLRLNRLAVTSLSLGENTSKKSLLERITKFVLITPRALN